MLFWSYNTPGVPAGVHVALPVAVAVAVAVDVAVPVGVNVGVAVGVPHVPPVTITACDRKCGSADGANGV